MKKEGIVIFPISPAYLFCRFLTAAAAADEPDHSISDMENGFQSSRRDTEIVSSFQRFIQTLTPVLLSALTEKVAVHSIAGIGKNRTQRITAYAQIS